MHSHVFQRYNHEIHVVPTTSDAKFQPHEVCKERSWVWVAKSDYSNNTGVPRREVFAVRFKTGAGASANF